MSMTENLEVIIRARIDQVLGKENLHNELSESARQINKIGSESTGKITGMIGSDQFPKLTNEEMASIQKISKALDATGRIVDEKAQELLQQYLEDEEIGLTKSQRRSYQRKFKQAGKSAGVEINDLLKFVEEEGADLPENKREHIELVKTAVKDMADEVEKSYDKMSHAIKEYHQNLSETSLTQDNFFKQLQQAGYFAVGGMAINQAGKIALTYADISAREKTAFDFTSPLAAYTEKENLELFKQNAVRSMLMSNAGMIAGGALGVAAGGGVPGALVGMGFGQGIGDMIASYFSKGETAEEQQRLKFFQQTYERANQLVAEYGTYDIAATKLALRFGEDLRGSHGFGFTKEQELGYKQYFGETYRKYEEDLYKEQLAFARMTGMEPNEVLSLNSYARITGSNYKIFNLDAARKYSKEIFGEDADSKRVTDILENIAQINLQTLKASGVAQEKLAAQIAAMPSLLMGVDSPYGRLGDYGNSTITAMASLGMPTSEAHEALLFQAYFRNNDAGLLGEGGVLDRMQGGVFYKDNMERILSEVSLWSGGDTGMAKAMLYKMLPADASSLLVNQLSKLVGGSGIDVVTGFDKDKNPISTHIDSLSEFINKYKEKAEELSGSNISDEEKQRLLNQYLTGAENSASNFEKTAEKISRVHGEIAEKWEQSILQTQKNMAEMEKVWLSSSKVQVDAMNKVSNAFISAYENLEKFGVYNSEDVARKAFHKKMYDIVYDKTGLSVYDVLDAEEIKKLKATGGSVLEEYESAAIEEHTKQKNWKIATFSPSAYAESLREEQTSLKKSIDNEQAALMNDFLREFKKELYDTLREVRVEPNVNVNLSFPGVSPQTKEELENSITVGHSEGH